MYLNTQQSNRQFLTWIWIKPTNFKAEMDKHFAFSFKYCIYSNPSQDSFPPSNMGKKVPHLGTEYEVMG